jgi:hypothetical protein
MAGGPMNEEHRERRRAIREARKVYFEANPRPPKAPKPPLCTKHYEEMCSWKTKPVSWRIAHRVDHICSFIIHAWLVSYPDGSGLPKLQFDIAHQMHRQHQLPGKLPLPVIMTIVGKLERENYCKTRMNCRGHLVVYRDPKENILAEMEPFVPPPPDDFDADREAEENWWLDQDDPAWLNDNVPPKKKKGKTVRPAGKPKEEPAPAADDAAPDDWFEGLPVAAEDDGGDSARRMEATKEEETRTYSVKLVHNSRPKEWKVKTRKELDASDPVMEYVDIPEGAKYTSRGPRWISPEKKADA